MRVTTSNRSMRKLQMIKTITMTVSNHWFSIRERTFQSPLLKAVWISPTRQPTSFKTSIFLFMRWSCIVQVSKYCENHHRNFTVQNIYRLLLWWIVITIMPKLKTNKTLIHWNLSYLTSSYLTSVRLIGS